MAWYFVVVIFLFSCATLSWLSSRLIKGLIEIAKYLRWKEFVIAFFVMAFAVSLPNFFVDIGAVLQNKPELAFGDIIGGNLVDLTLVLAIAVFFSKRGLSAKSGMVQSSAIFTTIISVIPLLLVLDGNLDRVDGLILILTFIFYSFWLFAKKERFVKIYDFDDKNIRGGYKNQVQNFGNFIKNLAKIFLLLALLIFASQAVISSAQFFSEKLGISLALVGILIVGLGNAFPETYFSIVSAKKEENYLVLGDLMGSVIVCSTLVLGIITLVKPFEIKDLSPFLIARIFLIVAAVLSLIFIRSGRKITKKEGLVLLLIYIIFLIIEIFVSRVRI